MKKTLVITGLAILSLLAIYSCKKDNFITGSDAVLNFSADTVLFDTVFTSLGSSRQQLTIYNPHDKKINISSIRLAGGERSPYRINIDGEATLETSDYELAPNDSLFIHVQVTINPSEANNPFIVKDSILFETDANVQDVDLVSYGQNAYFHAYEPIIGPVTWKTDRPHVIYGGVSILDTLNSSLTILAGTNIYFHDKAWLEVKNNSSLKILGTTEDPVTIQGDRLEDWYEDIPGQWGFIYLMAGSKDNIISNAIIRNGTYGVVADTLGASSEPTLVINNSIIENMAAIGVWGRGTSIKASNSVFANCGQYEVFLDMGGDYEFRHCTMGNYGSGGSGAAAIAMTNYYISGEAQDTIPRAIENAYFGNCIIYGNNKDEFVYSKTQQAELNYRFDHCLMKTKAKLDNTDYFSNCFTADSVYFHNPGIADYRLDTITSPAINAGSLEIMQGYLYNDLTVDIDGFTRAGDGLPDLGAYEFRPIEE